MDTKRRFRNDDEKNTCESQSTQIVAAADLFTNVIIMDVIVIPKDSSSNLSFMGLKIQIQILNT